MSLFLHFVMTLNLRQANTERKLPAHFKHKCMNLLHYGILCVFFFFFIKNTCLHYVLLKAPVTLQNCLGLLHAEHLNNSRSCKFPESLHPKKNEETNQKKKKKKRRMESLKFSRCLRLKILIPNQRVPSCLLGQYK